MQQEDTLIVNNNIGTQIEAKTSQPIDIIPKTVQPTPLPTFEIVRNEKKRVCSTNYFAVRNLFAKAEEKSLEGVSVKFREIITDLIKDLNELEMSVSLNAYFIRKLCSTR